MVSQNQISYQISNSYPEQLAYQVAPHEPCESHLCLLEITHNLTQTPISSEQKIVQRLQFSPDFARVCLKMCVLTMRRTWLARIFDVCFWGFFLGEKTQKSLKKSRKKCINAFNFWPILLEFVLKGVFQQCAKLGLDGFLIFYFGDFLRGKNSKNHSKRPQFSK